MQQPIDHRPDPQREPGTDVPPNPGEPLPNPENPDLPGTTPPGPDDPGHGQPIPPEMNTDDKDTRPNISTADDVNVDEDNAIESPKESLTATEHKKPDRDPMPRKMEKEQ